jgi:imidazolonepropionase-like amidohydrolase
MRFFLSLLLLAGSVSIAAAQQGGVLFEGARLITGNGSAPIENSAFLVVDNKFKAVGKKGDIQLPPGATRVNLTGKTVMPSLIDAHTHLGWEVINTGRINADTYTRENLIDHLQRAAYYGIAAVQSMGIDKGDIGYQIRADPPPNTALFRLAGRGMAMPNAGPGAEYWRPVAYGVSTEAEARADVRELAAKKADLVKIWVDDRNGTVKKLTPPLYRAIIDEAHKNNLRVAAHIFYLADAKELLRSGIDIFAHGVRDKDVDAELIALFKQHPNVAVIPNLPDRETTEADLKFAGETVPAGEIRRMRADLAAVKPDAAQKAHEFYGVQARNLAKLNAVGVRIAFGTDSSAAVGWNAHQEMTDMVAAGMTPAQVIVAATKTAAELVKLNQLGTVSVGKSADFLVLDANPLDDINNTRRISDVYLRGTRLNRAEMRAKFAGGSAQNTPSREAAEVLAFERDMEAAVVRGDVAYVERVSAPDLTFTHGDGWTTGGPPRSVDDRKDFLKRVENKQYAVRDLDSVKVEMHGNIAITYGRYIAQMRSAEDPANSWFSVWFERVYEKHGGQWLYVSHRTVHGPTYGPDRQSVKDK